MYSTVLLHTHHSGGGDRVNKHHMIRMEGIEGSET
jgi:hypothetical protein